MKYALDSVRQFHAKMNAPMTPNPTLLNCDRTAAATFAERVNALAKDAMAIAPEGDVLLRRASMALEELAEWLAAHSQIDLVAAADAWADRPYVLFGVAIVAGLPAAALYDEVHRSNMTKEPGPFRTGKAIKGPAYQTPDIQKVFLKSQESSVTVDGMRNR